MSGVLTEVQSLESALGLMGPDEAMAAADAEIQLYLKQQYWQITKELFQIFVDRGVEGDVRREESLIELRQEAAARVMLAGCGVNEVRGDN